MTAGSSPEQKRQAKMAQLIRVQERQLTTVATEGTTPTVAAPMASEADFDVDQETKSEQVQTDKTIDAKDATEHNKDKAVVAGDDHDKNKAIVAGDASDKGQGRCCQ